MPLILSWVFSHKTKPGKRGTQGLGGTTSVSATQAIENNLKLRSQKLSDFFRDYLFHVHCRYSLATMFLYEPNEQHSRLAGTIGQRGKICPVRMCRAVL